MKKARYDGPSGTGVDVLITLPDGQMRYVHVDQGHQLPTQMDDGTTIPASERDRLLKSDDWTEVEAATPRQTRRPKPAAADSASTVTPPAPTTDTSTATAPTKEG